MSGIFKFDEDINVLKNNNRVILANHNNKEWAKLSNECYKIFEEMNSNNININIEDYLNKFSDDDKEYLKNVINILRKKEILNTKKNITLKEEQNNKKIEFYLMLTEKCNLRCTHCGVSSEMNIVENISKESIVSIIDKLTKLNPNAITLTGGEPMINKDFFEIAEYLRKSYSGNIILMTNGTLINKSNVNFLVENFDYIDLSIDGVDEESCSKIRGKGVFLKVIEAVKLLQSHDFKNISLSMVFFDYNQHLFNDFTNLNKELSTKAIHRGFTPIGRGYENRKLFLKESMEDLNRYEDIASCNCFGCKAADIKEGALFIKPDGRMYPCQLLIEEKYCFENIHKIADLEMFIKNYDQKNSRSYKEVEELLPHKVKQCKDCNVNSFCWTCIKNIEVITSDDIVFNEYCKSKKEMLQKVVWGN